MNLLSDQFNDSFVADFDKPVIFEFFDGPGNGNAIQIGMFSKFFVSDLKGDWYYFSNKASLPLFLQSFQF